MSLAQATPDASTTRVSYEELEALLTRIFLRNGTSEAVATCLAANCAGCERDGSLSHGIFRVPGYISSLGSGWVDGRAVPEAEDAGPSFIRVDAQNGFAQLAAAAARPALEAKTRATGAAILAIRNSHHFSALWPDVEPFARDGLVALSVVNSYACVVPPGGRVPVFGTNPMAFAAPCGSGDPLVFDQAASALANGDVQIAAREGRLLPVGSGIDREGHLTGDPHAILDGGALLPFGGHKGASIALMIEILAAALTGGQFSFEVDWSSHPGAQTPRTGQFLIVIDPSRGGYGAFAGRVETLTRRVRAAGQTRLPGDRRYETRAKAMAHGIPVASSQFGMLQRMAREPGLLRS